MGVKKSSVTTRARSSAIRYTAASSPVLASDEHAGVRGGEEGAQDLRQLGLAEFTRSPGAVGQGAEPDPGLLVEGFGGHAER